MAKNTTDKTLDWVDVETDFKGAVGKAYGEMQAARKLAGDKRDAFETAFMDEARKRKQLADTQVFRFSYRFGKMAVAVDAADAGRKVKTTFKLGG